MKKSVYLVAMMVFALILSTFLASALTIRQVSEDIKQFYIDLFEPILGALFGGWDLGGLYLFEKFLIFVLLMSFIYIILIKVDLFKEKKFVIWLIAIIVPLIGVRFLNMEQIGTIIFSYKWLAVALTCILPLIIFFFFVYNIAGDHPVLRKILWGLMLAIYVGLYSSAGQQIDENVFVWMMIAIILIILFDRRIQQYFNLASLKKADKYWKYTAVSEIDESIRLLRGSSLPTAEIEKAIKEKEKEKKRILRDTY